MNIRQRCRNLQSRAVTIKLERNGWRENVTRQILVPCGECEFCRRQKQNEWSSRLYKHAIKWQKTHYRGMVFFCTFTISNEWFLKHWEEMERQLGKDMPKFVYENDIDSIQRTPIAKYIYNKYWKARLLDGLRAKSGVNLKGLEYYTCCEFGDHTERIHFHTIFYVPDFQIVKSYCYKHKIKPKAPWWVKGKNMPNGDRRLSTLEERYFESLLDLLWSDFDNKTKQRTPIGFTNINKACAKSFRYITKYVCKIKEDKEADKCPFHRQSFLIGMDEEEICTQLLKGLKYCEIQRANKVYKFRINKYYVDKYARLLGIKNEMSEDFLAKSRELVMESETDLNQIFECYVYDDFGNAVDVKHNDLVRIEYGHYEEHIVQTKAKFENNGKKIDIWQSVPRLLWFVDECITYLNEQVYEPEERTFSSPC